MSAEINSADLNSLDLGDEEGSDMLELLQEHEEIDDYKQEKAEQLKKMN